VILSFHPEIEMATVSHKNSGANSAAMREEIARRAYDLFLARGAEHGHHLDDWLSAEFEIARDSKSNSDGEGAHETVTADAVSAATLQASGNWNPDEGYEDSKPSERTRPARTSA
jgi:hypothetical protein